MDTQIANLCKIAIKNGGSLRPLLISSDQLNGPSLMNPSILNIDNNLIVNLRNVNYVLYHAEKSVNPHIWGPLCYLHTEQHPVLATNNILCKLNDDLQIIESQIINTSKLDVKPLWEFIGLEDGRLIHWNNKLFLSGVRRDTTTNGQGRIELSEINDRFEEISRVRIPAPPPDNSYCEKNWMPILDRPYTYIKWSNPTEVVQFDPVTLGTTTIFLGEYQQLNTYDLRGGSQVIPYKNDYLAVVHEVNLFNSESGKKNATYRHRFILWDKNFRLIKVSPRFDFMNGEIEFACGMCEYRGDILITFGFQDNAAYLLKLTQSLLDELLNYE